MSSKRVKTERRVTAVQDLGFEIDTATSLLEKNTPEIRYFLDQNTSEQMKKSKENDNLNKILRMTLSS
ncbi:hypothetical protein AYI70_g2478 [Smittium culicis]|uniref:Uncharacterized protein n=1 Tax=Smittium culicis TaxID=133412 RepID=A0A1R1Y877_9FUNG|nr:hypothetical protein AYI70_g2478 [Smittium culicis]